MSHLPSVASARISKSCSVIGLVIRSAFALGSNLDGQIDLLSFTCKIFLCLGFLLSILLRRAGFWNFCCFFDYTCHFWGFDVQPDYGQVSLLTRRTTGKHQYICSLYWLQENMYNIKCIQYYIYKYIKEYHYRNLRIFTKSLHFYRYYLKNSLYFYFIIFLFFYLYIAKL